MTQAYGYNEVSNGLKDIKHFGNDYDRNKIGPAHSNALAVGQTFRKFKQMTRLGCRFRLK